MPIAAGKLDYKKLKLSPAQLAAAQGFAEELGIGVNDDLYYFVILWCKNNVKRNGDFLTDKQRETFDKEVSTGKKRKNYIGTLQKKILGEIVLLSSTEVKDKNRTQTTKPATKNTLKAQVKTVRKKTQQAAPKPPKVTLSLDKIEVEKGESYTVSWKSENAILVSRSAGFYPHIPDIELSGSRTITANRIGSRTFSLTVRNSTGRAASAKITIQVVDVKIQPNQSQQTGSSKSTTTPKTTTPKDNRINNTDALTSIDKSLQNIISILKKQQIFVAKIGEISRREVENERRRKREGFLEFGKGYRRGGIERTFTPVMSILEKIWKFIVYTLLGRAFTEFLKWFNDPKNAGKVKTIGRFLKDFWPVIGGLALFFMVPFKRLIFKTIKTLFKFTGLLNSARKSVIFRNPLIAGISAFAILANEITGQRKAAPEQARQAAKVKSGKALDVPGVDVMNEKYKTPGIAGRMSSPTGMLEGIAFGGQIFSGLVTNNTGRTVRGAGPDTQYLPVEGGGGVVLQKGETVLQKGARERMISTTGIDPLVFNLGSKANRPRTISSKLSAMNTGGVIGKADNPSISPADYNTLLAITTAEDFQNPQGRADVAQALYNRLFAARKYGLNFNQNKATLKDIINAPGQFQPTFKNSKDWQNITDRQSAAVAFSKYKGISVNDALKALAQTDKILRDSKYQKNAAKHVQGRTFFLGQSEQGNMRKGDVLRGKEHNFFSHWETENTPYQKERGSIAAPIPMMLLPKPKSKPKPKPKKEERAWYDPRKYMGMKSGGLFVKSDMPSVGPLSDDRFPVLLTAGEYVIPKLTVQKLGLNFFDSIVANTDKNSEPAKLSSIPKQEDILPPIPMSSSMPQIMNLPPIVSNKGMQMNSSSGGNTIPSFPTVSPSSSTVRSMHAEIYGII